MNYTYTDLSNAPLKHRMALFHFANGATDDEVAYAIGVRNEKIAKSIREHPPIANALADIERKVVLASATQAMLHAECVDLTLQLNYAALNKAITKDEDGTPHLNMRIDSKGDEVPVLPASTMNKLLETALDHDPSGRFHKRSTLNVNNRTSVGFGGAALQKFKQEAALEGFAPAKVLEAAFTVTREGNPLLESAPPSSVADIGDEV